MMSLENKITSSFTINHAKHTLEDILENIDRETNKVDTTEMDKRKLDGIHRYLSNAINQIKEAQSFLK